MGTKIQTNSFLQEYHHSIINLDKNTSSLYHENQIASNGQNPDSIASRISKYDYSEYDIEKIRQTILKHESIFKNQVQELHRLHKRQRALMSEIKKREINKDQLQEQKFEFFSPIPLSPFPEMSGYLSIASTTTSKPFSSFVEEKTIPFLTLTQDIRSLRSDEPLSSELSISNTAKGGDPLNLTLARRDISANSCLKKFHFGPKDLFLINGMNDGIPLSKNEGIGRENLSNDYADTGTAFRRKRIFGVEISEGSQDPLASTGQTLGTNLNKIPKKDSRDEISFQKGAVKKIHNFDSMNSQPPEALKRSTEHSEIFQKSSLPSGPENSKGGLPWFLRNLSHSIEPSKGMKDSYFMNLDSLQNYSQNFFKKSETADAYFQNSKQNKEIASSDNKILGFRISDMVKDLESRNDESPAGNEFEAKNLDLPKGVNNYKLRHCFDLNLSLDEEDTPPPPFLPEAVVKIATSEIDLEAPAVIESETPKKRELSPEKSEECDRIAAEIMIAISLSEKNNFEDEIACEIQESESGNRLKWFAEIISSQKGGCDDEEEESIPDGMDYFEFMTLKLQETKEEQFNYEVLAVKNPSEKETLSKSSRRGRGRQRRDFQKDILPGVATLSRHQVMEGLQAFEELCKAEGRTCHLSKRSYTRCGRGRKRSRGVSKLSIREASNCSTPTEEESIIRRKMGFGEGNLSGWGKRTRRLPRNRCSNAVLSSSFPIKC